MTFQSTSVHSTRLPTGDTASSTEDTDMMTRQAFLGVNIFMIIIVSISTVLRLYTRLVLMKERLWADYTMIIAYLSFVVVFAFFIQAYNYGGGLHVWEVPKTSMSNFAYWAWVTEVFWHFAVASTRLTVCLQLMLIFVVGRSTKFWIATTFIYANVIYYTMGFLFCIFQCNPVSKVWNVHADGYCATAQYGHVIVVTGFWNLTGDVLMLLFPLYCVWNLKTSIRRRLAIAGLFMIGLLGIVASSFRAAFGITNTKSDDVTFTLAQIGESTVGELGAGILIGNLVVMPRFYSAIKPAMESWVAKFCARSSDGETPDPNYRAPMTPGVFQETADPSSKVTTVIIPFREHGHR